MLCGRRTPILAYGPGKGAYAAWPFRDGVMGTMIACLERGLQACDQWMRVGQPALQETVGQVQLPLCWIVTPQLSPLPLGLATSTWELG